MLTNEVSGHSQLCARRNVKALFVYTLYLPRSLREGNAFSHGSQSVHLVGVSLEDQYP